MREEVPSSASFYIGHRDGRLPLFDARKWQRMTVVGKVCLTRGPIPSFDKLRALSTSSHQIQGLPYGKADLARYELHTAALPSC